MRAALRGYAGQAEQQSCAGAGRGRDMQAEHAAAQMQGNGQNDMTCRQNMRRRYIQAKKTGTKQTYRADTGKKACRQKVQLRIYRQTGVQTRVYCAAGGKQKRAMRKPCSQTQPDTARHSQTQPDTARHSQAQPDTARHSQRQTNFAQIRQTRHRNQDPNAPTPFHALQAAPCRRQCCQ